MFCPYEHRRSSPTALDECHVNTEECFSTTSVVQSSPLCSCDWSKEELLLSSLVVFLVFFTYTVYLALSVTNFLLIIFTILIAKKVVVLRKC